MIQALFRPHGSALTLLTAVALCTGMASTAAMAAVIDRYDITPAEHAACDGDAQRLCVAAYPDEEKLLGCMKANRSQLTPVCLATFDAGLKKRHLDP